MWLRYNCGWEILTSQLRDRTNIKSKKDVSFKQTQCQLKEHIDQWLYHCLLLFQTTRVVHTTQNWLSHTFPRDDIQSSFSHQLATFQSKLCIKFFSMIAWLNEKKYCPLQNHMFARQTWVSHKNYFFLEYSLRPPLAPKFRTRCILASWVSIVSIMFMWSGMWT